VLHGKAMIASCEEFPRDAERAIVGGSAKEGIAPTEKFGDREGV
jgi:hypothetical protein